jgi:hypothetical protein
MPNFNTYTDSIMPTEMDVKLTVVSMFNMGGAVTGITTRYNTNSAFEPLVGGSTGVTPGFAHWSAFYGFYRVIAYEYEITMVNAQAFPVLCSVTNLNNDPTTTPAANITANPLTQHKIVSPVGGLDKVTFRKRLTIAQVAGTNAVEDGDSYRALVNANPADLFWLGVNAQSITGSTLTIGVNCVVYLHQYVRFYDRLQQ